MFYFFVALVGLLPFFTFASPTPVDYITNTMASSTDENVGNKLVFCHFMASYTFIALSNPLNIKH